MWRTEDSLREWVYFFHHMVSEDELGSLSYFSDPTSYLRHEVSLELEKCARLAGQPWASDCLLSALELKLYTPVFAFARGFWG